MSEIGQTGKARIEQKFSPRPEPDIATSRVKPASSAGSVLPKVPKSLRRKLRISHGVLDVLVAEVVLKGPRIDALVRQLVACGMTEHVWMDRKWHSRGFSEPDDYLSKTSGAHRGSPLA